MFDRRDSVLSTECLLNVKCANLFSFESSYKQEGRLLLPQINFIKKKKEGKNSVIFLKWEAKNQNSLLKNIKISFQNKIQFANGE